MKESDKVIVRESAKEWGCKIEDQMSFYDHYNQFRAYKLTTFASFVFFALIILVLLLGL